MENISSTTGGAYIPPSKLKLMQARITDKSSEAYQKLAWDALKKTTNGLINKVNVDNFDIIIKKLLSENVIRGRGILARTIIVAQSESPALTHVHAALVAVINSKFPQIGILIISRLLNDFQKSYKRNDKKRCLTSSRFFAHLVNQDVVNYVIIVELLFLLLDKTSNNSVEIAVGIMKEVGQKLEETSKAVCMAIFDKFRYLLNEGTLDKRVNYMIEVLFQIRKDKYTDYPIVKNGLNLVDQEDQTTHVLDLLSHVEVRDELNVFQMDPDFLENERKYEEMKEEILPESEEEEEDEEGGEEGGADAPVTTVEIQDQSFMSTVELRKKIYLKIHSALTHMDAAHLLLQIPLKPDQLYEMASMILDCCAQLRIYDNKFGYLAQQMCLVNHKYVEQFERLFCENYAGIHRLDMTKIRNLAMFFAHLICTDTVSWGILVVVKLTEKDTTSSGRIFLKHMFQEMRSMLGLDGMIARFREEEMQVYFQSIFPKDDLKDTKFAINYFTAIDLGKVTVDMRKYFEEAKTAKLDDISLKKKKKERGEVESSSSSDSSSDSSSVDSTKDRKKKTEQRNKKIDVKNKRREERSKIVVDNSKCIDEVKDDYIRTKISRTEEIRVKYAVDDEKERKGGYDRNLEWRRNDELEGRRSRDTYDETDERRRKADDRCEDGRSRKTYNQMEGMKKGFDNISEERISKNTDYRSTERNARNDYGRIEERIRKNIVNEKNGKVGHNRVDENTIRNLDDRNKRQTKTYDRFNKDRSQERVSTKSFDGISRKQPRNTEETSETSKAENLKGNIDVRIVKEENIGQSRKDEIKAKNVTEMLDIIRRESTAVDDFSRERGGENVDIDEDATKVKGSKKPIKLSASISSAERKRTRSSSLHSDSSSHQTMAKKSRN